MTQIEHCGKVIPYDFAPKTRLEVKVDGRILYADDYIMLARYEFTFAGRVTVYHLMGNLTTGAVTLL